MDEPTKSAGEHVWRQIRVDIHPRRGAAAVKVSARQHRGADLLVDRRLAAFGLALGAAEVTATTAGCMRAVAAALLDAADRLDPA